MKFHPAFDLRFIPHSRRGSYLAFTVASDAMPYGQIPEKHGLYFKQVHGAEVATGHAPGIREIFRMAPCREGRELPLTAEGRPEVMTVRTESGVLRACHPRLNTVRIVGEDGLSLLLERNPVGWGDTLTRRGDLVWEFNAFKHRSMFQLWVHRGTLSIDAPWVVDSHGHMNLLLSPDRDGQIDLEIIECHGEKPVAPMVEPFDAAVARVQADWKNDLGAFPPVAEEWTETRDLAAFIHWNNAVEPMGHIKRPALFDSKNWMNFVWGWGNTFLAMGLRRFHPEQALHMMRALLDHQDERGRLPDCYGDRTMVRGFAKPPIDGWGMGWMARRGMGPTLAEIAVLYEPLCRMTRNWTTEWDDDGDGIPQYMHGNDSGWDNMSVFDHGGPVESPDLAAYLILQMEQLSQMAEKLGKVDEARRWETESVDLLSKLLAHSWRGDHFVSVKSGNHEIVPGSDCLINFVPIILGKRLPVEVRETLAGGLREPGRFLTPWGLATESLKSPFFKDNGYWRGAIWPSPTLQIIDGLAEAGFEDQARDLALRYLKTFRETGSAENVSPIDGRGLCDRAYTWSSSVFLALLYDDPLFPNGVDLETA